MALSACDVKAEHQQKSIGNHAGLAPPCDACVIHSRFARDEIINLVVSNKNPKCDLSYKRYSPSKSITGSIKFTKRVEWWTDFWQLVDIFYPPGLNEPIVRKTDSRFFPLASHALRALRLARFPRVRLLRQALPIALLILSKKPTVLQSRRHTSTTTSQKYLPPPPEKKMERCSPMCQQSISTFSYSGRNVNFLVIKCRGSLLVWVKSTSPPVMTN